MPSAKIDLSVVTATYNERENVQLLIEELNQIFKENKILGEVVVVDDSSPDGTYRVVEELKKKYPFTILIKRPKKMGLGSAYSDGLKAARGETITFMDADFSHPPKILPELYKFAKENQIGWGSRYLGLLEFETDFAHLIGTTLLNKWISLWLHTRVTDNTLGYFGIRKETLNKILEYAASKKINPFDHVLYGISIIALARKLGFPVTEIKAPYEKRKFGETKIKFFQGLKIVLGDMIYTLKLFSKL